jgi:predicted RNA-binding Zn ribbon-like protein
VDRRVVDVPEALTHVRIEVGAPPLRCLLAMREAEPLSVSTDALRWRSSTRGAMDRAGRSTNWHRLPPGGSALARALLAADAIDLVVGSDHADLRASGAPGCLRLMLKDRPRRQWCSTRCGDRVRASRYYHRHRSTSGEVAE